jgi:hypothetical protein
MALEAWMKTATPGEKMDMTEPPSESYDRQEVIVLMGESHSGQKQKFLPIIRHGNGKFFNLGETTVPGMDKMEGRFAQILPPKVADAELREVAKVMLKVKGVNLAKPGAPSAFCDPAADHVIPPRRRLKNMAWQNPQPQPTPGCSPPSNLKGAALGKIANSVAKIGHEEWKINGVHFSGHDLWIDQPE